MAEIRYIHAADPRLGAPFSGLARDSSSASLDRLLKEAPFAVLDRLVQLCESKKPHFLALAGDIYDEESASVKARLKLREACRRLDDLGIPVLIACGSRGTLSSQFQSLKFPANVHVFPADQPQTVEIDCGGGLRALAHGASRGQSRESRDLALMFKRAEDEAAFQLGVLNCSVENADAGGGCAPCSLSDLKSAGLDAWALGGARQGRVLCDDPFTAYSGCAQGLHINEAGPKGCLFVRADNSGGRWRCQSEFHALGRLQWQSLFLDMDGAADQHELEERLARLLERAGEEADPAVSMIISRLIISGKTPLNSWLRRGERAGDLRAIISQSSGRPAFWLKDAEILTRDELDWEKSMAREDLLGETLRVYAGLAEDPEGLKAFMEKALEPLLSRPGLAGIFLDASEAEIKEALYQAESVCMYALEKH